MIHLPVGGSTAERTIKCPKWLQLKDRYSTTQQSNIYADTGNLLHDAMENYYGEGQSFEDQIGNTTYKNLTLAEEHLPLLESARAQVEDVLDMFHIEQFLCEPFLQYEEGRIGGSVDMLGFTDDGALGVVIDYKFGQNRVNAHNNSQMKFYAMCAVEDNQTAPYFSLVERWVLVIIQPACGETPDIYECPNSEIMEFEDLLLESLESSRMEVGNHCKYCPVAPYCPEKKKQAHQALVLSKTSSTELGQSWQLAQQLKSWIKEVEAEALEKLKQGANLPDLKLVKGRKSRVWSVPPEDLINELGDGVLHTTLLTPPAAEKLLGKKVVAKYIEEKAGNLTVAPLSDKREAVEINVEKTFEKLVAKDSKLF